MQESKSIATTKIEDSSFVVFTLNSIKTLRPKQWTKNLLVFAALVFSIKSIGWVQVFNSVIGFILFTQLSHLEKHENPLISLRNLAKKREKHPILW